MRISACIGNTRHKMQKSLHCNAVMVQKPAHDDCEQHERLTSCQILHRLATSFGHFGIACSSSGGHLFYCACLCYRCGISVAEQSGNGVPSLPSLAALLAFEFEFVKDWSVRRHICLKIDLISLVTNAHRHHITMMCSLCR